MTTDLRDRLDDLVAGVPDHVDVQPRDVWRAGARRRTRRRAVVTVAVVAATALVGGAVVVGQRMAGPQPAGGPEVPWWTVDSHPSRIDAESDPPDFTGEVDGVAGVVARSDGWYAVSPAGDLHRLSRDPDMSYLASISPDGTQVTFVDPIGMRRYDVGDAVGPELGSGGVALFDDTPQDYRVAPHAQLFWSPDSYDLLVPVTDPKPAGVAALLTGHTTAARRVRQPAGAPDAVLVGWLTRSELTSGGSTVVRAEIGWLDWPGRRLLVTSVEGGRVLRTVVLDDPGMTGDLVTASLATTGDGRLAVATSDGLASFAADGQVEDVSEGRVAEGCPWSWSARAPWWPSATGDGVVLTELGGDGEVRAAAGAAVDCSVWAEQALTGPAKG